MQKPNFTDLKKLIKAIEDTDAAFDSMQADAEKQRASIKNACNLIAAEHAKEALNEISVDELKNAKAGIRVSALTEAGYSNLGEIAKCTDIELQSIEGIGEKQTEAIRHIVTEFANSMSTRFSIVMDTNDGGNSIGLITELYRYMKSEEVRTDAKESYTNHKTFAIRISSEKIIRNSVRWLFSGNELKVHTLDVTDEIYAYCDSPYFERLLHFIDLYQAAINVTSDEAVREYEKNSADFYALLESLDVERGHRPFVYDSIPARLAEEIDETDIKLDDFKGKLRAYQLFGSKYILHQKKVLLGDEMGLGKTIQAIAVMSHINAGKKEEQSGAENAILEANSNAGITSEKILNPHFLVICPASVLINWSREIRKFSNIMPYILHGSSMESSFDEWNKNGGAAITNYESMAKMVDEIDNHMKIDMLVIDEAHYIKNPDAQRTKLIRRLDNESERILLMTGTPLENRVEEMCNLVEFIRPDMVNKVKAMAHMSSLPEFKETMAPMYLRRTRKQVLTELPLIAEEQEWCEMTAADKDAYVTAVMSGTFQSMRRVSFLQDNLLSSSKATRLMELCDEARDEGRKIVVFSFFRETLEKVKEALGDRCSGVINGDTKVEFRQGIIDKFSNDKDGSVLVCQIQSGGVGLNIQAASIVIFCEPQIKPSLSWQALSRVYRMGQTRNVLVYHLLCDDTVDEQMVRILDEKQIEFKNFADESVIADAYDNIMDKDWIKKVIEEENQKYLPMVI